MPIPSLKRHKFFNAEPGAAGSGTTAVTPPISEPQTFSREYVQELRHESAAQRTARKAADDKAEAAEAAAKKASEEADAKITAADAAANQRIIRAELKAAALKAGMVDVDGLKLADLSTVKLNADTGEVEGAEALMEALKKSKPYLFSNGSTTTSTDPKPKPKADEPVDVTKMSAEEYTKHKQALIRKSR